VLSSQSLHILQTELTCNRDINPSETAINERLKALEWGLSTSKFGPETQNIQCAISGYQSGLITYSSNFTIIYAGHIVDTAPDYSSFVLNRDARLDKYCALHGPGWMWYEAPLNTPPDSRPRLFPGVALQRGPGSFGLESYFVNQGFWKRAGFVSRMPMTAGNRAAPQEQLFQVNEQDQVFCQNNQGPLLVFRTLLDSGATFPSLPQADFASLGIDLLNYGAQSITTILHTTGVSHVRVYEMSVCVTDNECRNLVIVDDAVWPNSFKYLGSFMPVIAHTEPSRIDEEGREIVMRISGLMPFLACYVSSTPTEPYIYLGEDRNDVLGAHRMPGQRKWAVEMGYPKINDAIASDKFGNPKITFNHRGGMVIDVDEEHRKHASQIHVTLPDGRKDVKYICPADMIAADRAKMAQNIPESSNQGPFEASGGNADDILPQNPYMGAAEGSPWLPRQ
jgi:hypothetical protein